MRTIKLYGELGKKYGRVHQLEVRTTAEAIRALSANYKGFRQDLESAHEKGVGFRIRNGRHDLTDVNQIKDPGSKIIQIIPTVIGSNAESRILIGIAIIAIVIATGGIGATGFGGFAAQVGLGIGNSLVLGGVMQLLSTAPKTPDIPERPENTPSYTFNGPVNTTAQGHPVPVGYGRLIVGGAVISAGINLEQTKSGFYKTRSETSREVHFDQGTTNIFILTGTSVPGNWFKREYIGIGVINIFGLKFYDRWTYYYYVWTHYPL